jgi:heme A synthase
MNRLNAAFYLALFSILVTFCLIMLGNLVHNTGSSLACPDWPLCYGEVFPEMKGGVLYEHSHRYLGSLAGLCSILLVFFLWSYPGSPSVGLEFKIGLLGLILASLIAGGYSITDNGLQYLGRFGMHAPKIFLIIFLAILFVVYICCLSINFSGGNPGLLRYAIGLMSVVCFQGLLGGATVAYKLPTLVSTAHLGTSLLVLTGWILLAIRIWQVRHDRFSSPGKTDAEKYTKEIRSLSVAVFSVVFIQVIIGALVRHTGVSGAAGLGPEYMILGHDIVTGYPSLWPATGEARLNMFHRLFAFLVTLIVFVYSGRCWFIIPSRYVRTRMICWTPSVIVIAQVFIGMMMLGMGLPGTTRIAHLVGAATLLCSLVLIIGVFPRPAAHVRSSTAGAGPEI